MLSNTFGAKNPTSGPWNDLKFCINLGDNSYQLDSKFQGPNFNRFGFFAKIDSKTKPEVVSVPFFGSPPKAHLAPLGIPLRGQDGRVVKASD